jgi:uncharacterized membrane protein
MGSGRVVRQAGFVGVVCALAGFVIGGARAAGGKLDASFGSGGTVLTDLGAASNEQALAVAVQKDGKIVAAGFSTANGSSDFALARYTK